MSESLRDQLLKAGFSQSKKDNPPKSSKSTQTRSAQSKSTNSKSNNSKTTKESVPARKPTGTSRVFKAGSASKADQRQRYRSTQSVRSDGQAASGTRKKAKKAPAIKPRSGSWSTRSPVGAAGDNQPTIQAHEPGSSDTTQNPTITGKEAIEKLIEENTLKSCEGDQTYRFTLQNRIREITTNEQTRQKLSESELGIATMNSGLHIVPASIVREIRELNAQWDAFLAHDDSAKTGSDTPAEDASDYDDFPIPDDLIW